MTAAVAMSNAKLRARLGWPLVLLTIAVYAPIGGPPRLALIATGLFFLAQSAVTGPAGTQGKGGAGPRTPKPAPGPKTPRPHRPAKPAPSTRARQASADPAKTPKPPTKVPRQRAADGRWAK
ncbi:hypothetical protein [Kitasatospora indigofera]|uniref:hypothetical protein n=1 Tax=Kitasatospora indigofera TaxID=67307 RepID=UPI0036C185DA